MADRRPLVLIDGILREIPSTDQLLYAGAVTDHGVLTGLTDDDHTQYYNQTRGDARYSQIGHTHSLSDLAQSGATTNQTLTWNGTNWVPVTMSSNTLTVARATMGSTQSSSSTTLADVTSLVAAMDANSVYRIECFVTFQSAATTTGLNLGLLTPSGCVNRVEIVVPITSTAAASQLRTTFPNAATASNAGNVIGTGVTATGSNHTARISGLLINGANAGNCQIQFASEVSSSAVTLQTASELVLIKLA